MNDSDFEKILNDIDSRSSDQDFLSYLEQQVNENSTNFDYFQLCIKYFPHLESEHLIYYFLCIFRVWVNLDIDLEIISEIKNIFFSQMKATSTLINAIQMSVQIRIFLKVYPSMIPTFWADFFRLDTPIQLKLNFIDEFSNLLLDEQVKRKQKEVILQQMKSDNSELEIIQFLLHLIIDEKNENALLVLVKNLAFIDPFEAQLESNELMNVICSLINENILPMIMNDLALMPTNIIDISSDLDDQDLEKLKEQINQNVSSRHDSFYHIENVIIFLYHIISSKISKHSIIDQLFPEFCNKIQSIHHNSIELLNQLFELQNSPLISPLLLKVYENLGIDLCNDIYSILTAVSNFVSKSFLKFNEDEIIQSFYFPISLSLLKIPNDNVSLHVIDFIKKYSSDSSNISTDEYTEKIKIIFFTLANRLTIYFLNNSIEENDFYLALFDAFKSILSRVNKQTKILDFYVNSILLNHTDLITLIIESVELKSFKSIEPPELELPLLSSMLVILDAARDKYIKFSKIGDVIDFCKNLLDIKPPISIQQFYAITYYMKYAERVASEISGEDPLFQLMFESLYNFLIFDENMCNCSDESDEIEQISEKMKEKFILITQNLIRLKKFYLKVEIEKDQVVSLVKTASDDIILIASKIISNIPDNEIRLHIFEECLEEMMTQYSNSSDETQSILNILAFIQYEYNGSSENDDSEEQNQLVLSFCEQLFEVALNNEKILLNYLEAIQKVLDIKGVPLFLQCIDKIYDDLSSEKNSDSSCFSLEIATLICRIANLYVQQDPKNEWKFVAFCKIFDMVNGFREFDVSDWSSKQSEEVREITNLFQNFFLLSAHSCKFLDVKKNLDILNYLEENVLILFQLNSTEPLYDSLNYLCSLTSFLSNEADESFSDVALALVEKFIEISFSIVKIEDFSVTKKWTQIIEMIFKFHKLLFSICHDGTEEKLRFCFEQFPQSELRIQFQSEYFQFIQLEEINEEIKTNVEKIFQFLHDESESKS